MEYESTETVREYVGRLETGADWREEIESLARRENVDAGWFTGLGAVQDAELWYYDQAERTYRSTTFEEPLEVAACVGNVSRLGDGPFAHTHAVLSREGGRRRARPHPARGDRSGPLVLSGRRDRRRPPPVGGANL